VEKSMTKVEQRATELWSKTFGGLHTWVYKKSGGAMGARFVGGAPVMLLTTIGRKSGKPRTSPLLYLLDGEKVITVASHGGHPRNPAWYLNLLANAEVEVQIGNERRKMRAATATAQQKERYWPRLRAVYPPYQSYQDRTDRDIPVVILRPS
jgi:deazaflavin-dependent oxidoreductase (nitroreductase family)